MKQKDKNTLNLLIKANDNKTYRELVLSDLRYEALRKLNLRQYTELIQRNIHGENFDEMVDEMIVEDYERG